MSTQECIVCMERENQRLREALEAAIRAAKHLEEQHAMPDDGYKHDLERAIAALARNEATPKQPLTQAEKEALWDRIESGEVIVNSDWTLTEARNEGGGE